jgi:ComF family protein
MRPISANRLARAVLGAVVPPRCGICDATCATSDPVCATCARELNAARPGAASLRDIERLVWATSYEGTPRALVSALKFQGRLPLADLAAELIAVSLDPAPATITIVPVPASPLRKRTRGFDPAELIAARLAARLGLPLSTCLRRADHGRQVGKPRARRLADPPAIRVQGTVPGAALLVDDVATTGATLSACAAALRAGGCRRMRAAVFARSS